MVNDAAAVGYFLSVLAGFLRMIDDDHIHGHHYHVPTKSHRQVAQRRAALGPSSSGPSVTRKVVLTINRHCTHNPRIGRPVGESSATNRVAVMSKKSVCVT